MTDGNILKSSENHILCKGDSWKIYLFFITQEEILDLRDVPWLQILKKCKNKRWNIYHHWYIHSILHQLLFSRSQKTKIFIHFHCFKIFYLFHWNCCKMENNNVTEKCNTNLESSEPGLQDRLYLKLLWPTLESKKRLGKLYYVFYPPILYFLMFRIIFKELKWLSLVK